MSLRCVDAVIQTAHSMRQPIMLIASRRQIECATYGGGYVNNWSTEQFVRYVKQRDTGGFSILCRDHGGPRQHPSELAMSDEEALQSAKYSLAVDIAAGFSVVHLDLSGIQPSDVAEVLGELYSFVSRESHKCGSTVAIELGYEVQSGDVGTSEELRRRLEEVGKACKSNGLGLPLFFVAQTGTLVEGLDNRGAWSRCTDPDETNDLARKTAELVDVGRMFGVFIKEHNCDYLDASALRVRPALGIGGVNIAPELGTLETTVILQLAEDVGCSAQAEAFLRLAYESKKWTKWFELTPNASDRAKAIAAGHYVFGVSEFDDLFSRISKASRGKGIDADAAITSRLRRRICELLGYLSPTVSTLRVTSNATG